MATIVPAQQTAIANLYTALFNRAPDAAGFGFWVQALSNGASLSTITQGFLSSPESKAIYPAAQTSEQFITTFYTTVFGRAPDAAGLAFWAGVVNANGGSSSDAAKSIAVTQIINTVSTQLTTKPADITDAQYAQTVADRGTFINKGVVGVYYAVEAKGTSTDAAKQVLAGVNATEASVTAAKLIADGAAGSGSIFNLTSGVDTIVGTSGADTINVTPVNASGAAADTAQTFDKIDGGSGIDTLNWYATGAINQVINPTITNVEIANFFGAENITGGINAALVGGSTNININAVGAAGVTVTGLSGKTLGIVGKQAGAIVGNFGTATAAAVSLTGASDAAGTGNAAVDVAGVATTLSLAGAGRAILTDNAGAADTLKTLNVAATGAVVLDLTGLGALTAIDASASTAATTLSGIAATVVSIKTGSGVDTLSVTATAKATVDTGAGADVVTLNSILAAGSTVNLGAGNDKLLGSAKAAVSTLTVIDGGDGIDTLGAALINNGNAAQFKNFEILGLEGATTLDVALMTGSTLTGLELVSGGGTYSNVALTQALAVNTNTTGTATSLVFTGVAGAADAYSINFGSTSTGTAIAPTTIDAGTLTIAGVETVNIKSAATSGVAANAVTLTAAQLQQVAITGDQALTLAFNGTNGTIVSTVGGVSSIDGSAATGKLSINVAGVTAATAGLTVKGGTAADTLTTAAFATTLTGGAGNDNFVVKATLAGAGVSATPVFATITDFAKGDTVSLVDVAGTTNFNATKVNVDSAVTLANALDLAGSTSVTATNATVSWFQYGGNTYIVQDTSAAAATTLGANDVVVKLAGLLDLSTATISAADVLTFA